MRLTRHDTKYLKVNINSLLGRVSDNQYLVPTCLSYFPLIYPISCHVSTTFLSYGLFRCPNKVLAVNISRRCFIA